MRFFVLGYRKRHFNGLSCLKKKVVKMAIFWPKPWVNPFEKMSIFRLFSTCCFYSVYRRFLSLEYHKRHFPGLYCLKKKKLKKWPFLEQKQWVNPFGKMSIFRLFPTCCFYSLERRFLSLDYHKRHFPGLYCLKKKSWKNGYFWTKTIG